MTVTVVNLYVDNYISKSVTQQKPRARLIHCINTKLNISGIL